MSRPRSPLEPKTVNVDAIAAPKGIGGNTREAQDRATEKYTLGYWHQRVEELEIALSKRAQDHAARVIELEAEISRLKAERNPKEESRDRLLADGMEIVPYDEDLAAIEAGE